MRIVLALLAALVATPTHAADLKSTKDSGSIFAPLAVVSGNPFSGLYGGVTAGAQFTDITISDHGQDFSGISADGAQLGGHVGFNWCPGRVCIGPAAEFAWSNVAVEFGPLGDVLRMDDYLQLTVQAGVVIGKKTLVSVHAGYEWQSWVLDLDRIGRGEHDADVEAWVVGFGIATMVTSNTAVELRADYLMFNDIDADDLDRSEARRALDKSDALRIKLKATYYLGGTDQLF